VGNQEGLVENLLDAISRDGVFVVRLLVAMVLGGLVGMERQTRGRAAGLRTNILVCLGAAGIIVAFQKLSMDFNMGAESVIRMDPARAAAGVITGIGFLGAGTIVKSKDFVRGLTTAARRLASGSSDWLSIRPPISSSMAMQSNWARARRLTT
jgi:putative Mg2+ transporter-C (MgtC) family protein